ncbi:hypothetical protein GCM10029978_026840 [Actinoallomurus acanthiterrae]
MEQVEVDTDRQAQGEDRRRALVLRAGKTPTADLTRSGERPIARPAGLGTSPGTPTRRPVGVTKPPGAPTVEPVRVARPSRTPIARHSRVVTPPGTPIARLIGIVVWGAVAETRAARASRARLTALARMT